MTSTSLGWNLAPGALILAGLDVHVWRVSLKQSSACIDELAQTLSHDELTRADRFSFSRDRQRFVVCRGMLRKILSEYLKVEPSRLRFSYEEKGKPHLVGGFHESGLQFNLAHSHELALYAFTLVRRIGVDLEYIRPLPDIDQISKRFFSAFENATLDTLPQGKKLQAFYNCWTRKEAYLKATGEGLSRSLADFDVSLTPGEPAKLLSVRDDRGEAKRWSFWSSTLDSRYVAAVCIEGQDWRLKTWERLLDGIVV